MDISTFERRSLCLLGALLLFSPAFAAVVGVRGQPIENRPLSKGPSIDKGWDALDDITLWANDHLPLRDGAVRTDAWIDEHVFGDNPAAGQSSNPKVVLGKANWLFLAEDFSKACKPPHDVGTVLETVTYIHNAFARLGKRFVFVVAPDKTTFMDSQVLPGPHVSCARKFKANMWLRLRNAPPDGYTDLLGPLEEERNRSIRELYHRSDTHWNDYGAIIATKAIVESLDSELWGPESIVRLDDVSKRGDLARMLGKSSKESIPRLLLTNHSGPVWPGKTVLLYDSFGKVCIRFLQPFFSDLESHDHLLMSPGVLSSNIRNADTVIYQVVERHLLELLGDPGYWQQVVSDLEGVE